VRLALEASVLLTVFNREPGAKDHPLIHNSARLRVKAVPCLGSLGSGEVGDAPTAVDPVLSW
jgi:hypothetical protein